MNRRRFLQVSTAGLALAAAQAQEKRRRVALIGSGWYGKCDLLRLIQVEPVGRKGDGAIFPEAAREKPALPKMTAAVVAAVEPLRILRVRAAQRPWNRRCGVST
jgi:hypothetical protein